MLMNKLKLKENIEYFEHMREWGHWVATNNLIDRDGQSIEVEVLDSRLGGNCITIRLYYKRLYITSIYCYPQDGRFAEDAWSLSAALDIMHEMARL